MSDVEIPAGETVDGRVVRPYDLFRRDNAGPTRMPTLEVINDRFGRSLKLALFHHLRKGVDIETGVVETLKHFEMIERLSTPTYLALIGLKPLRGTMLVAIDARLLVAIVESRFGGNGRFPVTKSQRDFTTVEHKVMSGVMQIVLEHLTSAWHHVATLKPEILRNEFNPQFAGVTASTEPVVTITFKIKIDNGDGTMMLGIPLAMLDPVHDQLMSSVASDPSEPDGHWFEQLKTGVEQVVMPVRVELAEIEMSISDLLELRPGDVFEIERPDSVMIEAEGVALFRGRWGRFGTKSAVRIDDIVKPDEESPERVNGRSE